MLGVVGRWYRLLTPVIVLAYCVGLATCLVLYRGSPDNRLLLGILGGVICLAAVPLEAIGARFRRLVPGLVVVYIVAFALAFFLLNLRLSVEWVAIVLIGSALVAGMIKVFLRDWAAFIAVVIAWQITDGLAGAITFPLHIRAMIDADRFLFGAVPTIWLQAHLFHPNRIMWYDVVGVVVYSLHFLLPLAAGFVLWLANRRLYYRYAAAFVAAAVVGFGTYILFPAAPPWMAVMHCINPGGPWTCTSAHPHHFLPWVYSRSLHRWVPSVRDVWNHTMAGWLTKNNGNIGFGPLHLGFDQVGAIPSEHVMYPSLVFLFFRRQFGRIGYLMLPYIGLVTFSVVYLGQHYVIDGIVGAIYAIVVYVGVMHVAPWAMTLLRPRRHSHGVLAPMPAPAPRTDDLVRVPEAAERVS